MFPGSRGVGRWSAALLLGVALMLGSAPAALRAQVPEVVAPSDTLYTVRLADGSNLIARVVAVQGERITLVTEAGVRVEVERSQIRSLRPAAAVARDSQGATMMRDPNRTRLMFGPTGRSLRAGEGYVGLFELFLPFVAVGVTDWVTVAGGTPVVPGGMGEVFYLAPKVRVLETPRLQVATGVLAFFLTDNSSAESVGILYGVGSYGDDDHALTLGGGFPFTGSGDDFDDPVVLVGGESRTGRRTKLITENYLIPSEGSAMLSGGLRLFGESFSGDVGLGAFLGRDTACCLPLLNFVYNFGGRR